MLNILLVQPGSTDFDDQRRIKGTLDMPLSESGREQVVRIAADLAAVQLDAIYSSPCTSALQTAQALADPRQLRVKSVDALKNVNHGLWHGKLIEEVRRNQPKVYRLWQEHPETVCPPEGEAVEAAQSRVRSALAKLGRKHKNGTVALVVPEPLASIVRSQLEQQDLRDLWQSERDCGAWRVIAVEPHRLSLLTG